MENKLGTKYWLSAACAILIKITLSFIVGMIACFLVSMLIFTVAYVNNFARGPVLTQVAKLHSLPAVIAEQPEGGLTYHSWWWGDETTNAVILEEVIDGRVFLKTSKTTVVRIGIPAASMWWNRSGNVSRDYQRLSAAKDTPSNRQLGIFHFNIIWRGYLTNSLAYSFPIMLFILFRSFKRLRKLCCGLCEKCGYDLRGLEAAHACPECGNYKTGLIKRD